MNVTKMYENVWSKASMKNPININLDEFIGILSYRNNGLFQIINENDSYPFFIELEQTSESFSIINLSDHTKTTFCSDVFEKTPIYLSLKKGQFFYGGEPTMCVWCKIYPASKQDYRRDSKFHSCELCYWLNDKTVRKIQKENIDPEIYYKPLEFKFI